jgi:hypothetical protein
LVFLVELVKRFLKEFVICGCQEEKGVISLELPDLLILSIGLFPGRVEDQKGFRLLRPALYQNVIVVIRGCSQVVVVMLLILCIVRRLIP